jgi:L-asparagine transporter-like permease
MEMEVECAGRCGRWTRTDAVALGGWAVHVENDFGGVGFFPAGWDDVALAVAEAMASMGGVELRAVCPECQARP